MVRCQGDISYRHAYDIVIGKTANDDVGEAVFDVMQGIMCWEDAVERLRFERINDQIAFCTEKALRALCFVKCHLEVTRWTTRPPEAAILPEIVGMIQKRYELSEDDALRMFYESATDASFADDETGLDGQQTDLLLELEEGEKMAS